MGLAGDKQVTNFPVHDSIVPFMKFAGNFTCVNEAKTFKLCIFTKITRNENFCGRSAL